MSLTAHSGRGIWRRGRRGRKNKISTPNLAAHQQKNSPESCEGAARSASGREKFTARWCRRTFRAKPGESDSASAWVAFLRKLLAATAQPEFIVLGFPEQGFVLSLGFRGICPLMKPRSTVTTPLAVCPCSRVSFSQASLRLLKVWLGKEGEKKKKSGTSSALMMSKEVVARIEKTEEGRKKGERK